MKVLIAEDELVSGRLLESLLQKWGYEVVFATNGRAAWEMLQQYDAPHLAVLDWMMPEMDGVEVCQRLRSMKRSTYTYVILLTAKREKNDILQGLEAGVDDYITKPFDRDELQWRLRIGERILDLESRLQRKLMKTASADSLTGVTNRRAFMERLMSEMDRARRQDSRMAVLLLDIDKFSRLNDEYGYLAGDIILQEIADFMHQKSERSNALIARYGGDEFIACYQNMDASEAKDYAEQLREELSALRITIPSSLLPVQVSASVGVTVFSPQSGETVDSVILRAEEALYQAKNHHGNQAYILL